MKIFKHSYKVIIVRDGSVTSYTWHVTKSSRVVINASGTTKLLNTISQGSRRHEVLKFFKIPRLIRIIEQKEFRQK